MANYLKTIYFRDEQGVDDHPQKLCDHLIKKLISPHFGPDAYSLSLLDVGSGKGNHLVGFARRNFVEKGVDSKQECIDALPDYDIRECNIEKRPLPFEDESFDVVFSKSVIEHVYNVDNLLNECYRVLKKNGLIILMTPDWNTQHEMFWDDYTHVKAWTRKSLQNALKIKDFKLVECILFRQMPILWKHPWLKIICDIVALLPHSFKWKDSNEEHHRPFIRFSKEKMLLATGVKL